MDAHEYQIESNSEILGPWLAPLDASQLRMKNRELAVSVAAKSYTAPRGQEIRVVHVRTGQVVFRKTDTRAPPETDA